MAAHERFELSDELPVATEGEVRVDPVLERSKPLVLGASYVRLRKWLIREVSERLAAPQAQRPPEGVPCAPWIAVCKAPPSLHDERLELLLVDEIGIQHVAA